MSAPRIASFRVRSGAALRSDQPKNRPAAGGPKWAGAEPPVDGDGSPRGEDLRGTARGQTQQGRRGEGECQQLAGQS